MTNKNMSAEEIAGLIQASSEIALQTKDLKTHYRFTSALWDLAMELGISAEVDAIFQAKAMKDFDESIKNQQIKKT